MDDRLLTRRTMLRGAVGVGLGVALNGKATAYAAPPGSARTFAPGRTAIDESDPFNPSLDPKPPAETDGILRMLRLKHGVFSLAWSDIYAYDSGKKSKVGNDLTLAAAAFEKMGEGYYKSPDQPVTPDFPPDIQGVMPIVPREHQTPENREAIDDFAGSYKLLEIANAGFMANALYSTADSNTTGGGEEDFPVNAADVRYLANATNMSPGAGLDKAVHDFRASMINDFILKEFNNAVLIGSADVEIEGKAVDARELMNMLRDQLLSADYQRYLADVEAHDAEALAGARYWMAKELATLRLLSPATADEVSGLLHVNMLAYSFDQFLNVDKDTGENPGFDGKVSMLVLERLIAANAGATSSALKNAIAALAALYGYMEEHGGTPQGLAFNAAIRKVFQNATALIWTSQIQGVLPDRALQDIIDTQTIFAELNIKRDVVDQLKKLNSSGLLGSVGGVLVITSWIMRAMVLDAAVARGDVKPADAVAMAAATFGVYSAVGSFRTLFQTITQNAPTTVVQSTIQSLSIDQTVREIYDLDDGLFWTGKRVWLPRAELEEGVAEFGVSTGVALREDFRLADAVVVDELLDDALGQAIAKLPETQREIARDAFGASQTVTADVIEELARKESAAIERESILLAEKAFSYSLAAAGALGSVLWFASDIIGLVNGATSPTSVLFAVSDGLAVVSSLISVQVLVTAAAATSILSLVGIGIGLVASVLGLAAACMATSNAYNSERVHIRDQTSSMLSYLQNRGYLSNWGGKIRFLSCYFDRLRDKNHRQRRWTPDELSIFTDEETAWRAWLQQPRELADDQKMQAVYPLFRRFRAVP